MTAAFDLIDLIGEVLDGKYRIGKPIGSGGMGVVYLATHLGTERPVALKVIAPENMADSLFVERFRREAVAAGRILHPNVVNVTDFGIAHTGSLQIAYLVMEYLKGLSLRELLEQFGALPEIMAIDILEQVCVAVDAAHKLGIVHRDLKPDNIFLQPDGRGAFNVKVLDFGLAKLHETASKTARAAASLYKAPELEGVQLDLDASEEQTLIKSPRNDSDSVSNNTIYSIEAETLISNTPPKLRGMVQALYESSGSERLTQHGSIMGTPFYMSPEQCRGEEPDYRTDIYSLGVIAYEMLSGSTPFSGNLKEILEGHLKLDPPSLEKHGIGSGVAEAIMCALSKNPERRPSSAISFLHSLRANSEGDVPLLREAFDKYRGHTFTFLLISLFVYLPYILFGSLMIAVTKAGVFGLFQTTTDRFSTTLLLLPLAIIANRLCAAAFVQPTGKLIRSHRAQIEVLGTLKEFYRACPKLLVTTFSWIVAELRSLFSLKFFQKGYAMRHTLFHAVVMQESLSGGAALERSAYLVSRMPKPAVSVQARSIFLSLLTVMGGSFVMVLLGLFGSMLGNNSFQIFPDRAGIIPSYITIPLGYMTPWLLLVIVHPYVSIASAIHYFRTREIVGEEHENQALIDFSMQRRAQDYSRTRLLVMASSIVLMFGLWHLVLNRALVYVSSNGLSSAIEALLIVGADANVRVRPEALTEYETTPLLNAVSYGSEPEVLEILIRHGADPNNSNNYLWTPLHEAINQGAVETVEFLLKHGANPNCRNNPGWTPLMHAVRKGDLRIMRLLFRSGARVNDTNNDGDSALSIAVMYGQAYAIEPLLVCGADPNLQNSDGETALMLAADGGDSYIVRLLLAKGARLDLKDRKGRSAIDFARENDNHEIVQLLNSEFQRLKETE